MALTSRERINAALEHQEPDRTPMFEYVLLSPVADHFLKRKYAGDPDNWEAMVGEIGWEQAVRRNAIDRLELARRLGHDMLYVVPNPLPRSGKPAIPESRPVVIDDPVENVRQRLEKAKASIQPPDDNSLLVYRYLKEEMEKRGLDLPILAPAYAHGVWTDIDLMQTMVLATEVAHEHFQLATRKTLLCIEKYLEYGIDQFGVGGDFAGNRPLISPQSYREFIVPEVRILSRAVHRAGKYAVNASDGNLWTVLEDFLVACEVDGYLEIDLHAGMELPRLKQQYGSRITFYGNLDCGNTLSFGTPEEVKKQTRECLEAGWGHGGHILCASNAITASVPAVNYLTMLNTYRDMFNLPRLF